MSTLGIDTAEPRKRPHQFTSLTEYYRSQMRFCRGCGARLEEVWQPAGFDQFTGYALQDNRLQCPMLSRTDVLITPDTHDAWPLGETRVTPEGQK